MKESYDNGHDESKSVLDGWVRCVQLCMGLVLPRPAPNKAIGAGVMRTVFSASPIYWSLAFTAAFACSSLYLYLKFRR